ncbi:MAG TPA: hypothetical protein VEP30_11635 [Chthoniobacterales bacterium]|nr:hypothetical protein [Chthoniobacterales bacterium]
MKILPVICCCITAVIISWIFSTSGRFEIREVSGIPYVINRTTGEMWKWYWVAGQNGNNPNTGFERIVLH